MQMVSCKHFFEVKAASCSSRHFRETYAERLLTEEIEMLKVLLHLPMSRREDYSSPPPLLLGKKSSFEGCCYYVYARQYNTCL
jgi:hypothetical protein